tara:strand:- start:8728 stop:9780 length:1053 start_codon:yes stop_codon:yes gene_type:complete
MKNFYKNKKIIITGHTGFKGSWLTLMLSYLGANIHGFSLKPKSLSLFKILNLEKKILLNNYSDIRNFNKLNNFIKKSKPDLIFHLAAQPIVSEGFSKPKYTWDVNVNGTLNLLKSLDNIKKKCAVVIITTDKVYLDKGKKSYIEESELGGSDPYSISKVAVEKLTSQWIKINKSKNLKISVARAGNVVGGGDWSKNRLIPDLVRKGNKKSNKVYIRNPGSIRPWQYVLGVLVGYLKLGMKTYKSENKKFQSPYNFGPNIGDCKNVKYIVSIFLKFWNSKIIYKSNIKKFKETKYLFLNSKKARKDLNWISRSNLNSTIKKTLNWYKHYYYKKNIFQYSLNEIKNTLKNEN